MASRYAVGRPVMAHRTAGQTAAESPVSRAAKIWARSRETLTPRRYAARPRRTSATTAEPCQRPGERQNRHGRRRMGTQRWVVKGTPRPRPGIAVT